MSTQLTSTRVCVYLQPVVQYTHQIVENAPLALTMPEKKSAGRILSSVHCRDPAVCVYVCAYVRECECLWEIRKADMSPWALHSQSEKLLRSRRHGADP